MDAACLAVQTAPSAGDGGGALATNIGAVVIGSHTRAVMLDALGTLVALQPPAPALKAQLARRFGVHVTEAQAAQALAAEIAFYRAHFDDGRDPAAVDALRQRCAEALRGALPARDEIAAIGREELTEALVASLNFSAFVDAPPALAAARASGLRLVVVSNWDASLPEVLARVKLAPWLDAVLTSAQIGARKPSRRIFDCALEVVGVDARECVHVGDSLEDDVAGARAAGIEAVLIRRDGAPGPRGVPTIASLAEL